MCDQLPLPTGNGALILKALAMAHLLCDPLAGLPAEPCDRMLIESARHRLRNRSSPDRHAVGAGVQRFSFTGEAMLRSLVVPILFSASALAGARTLNFCDVRAKNATRLGADELRTLMPGAKVISRTPQGSTYLAKQARRNVHGSSDGRGSCGGRNCYAIGIWRIQDNGTLCVTIKWPTVSEDWCRYVFKAGDDKYYAVGKREDNATANEFEFSK
jgi:hypothetical protein